MGDPSVFFSVPNLKSCKAVFKRYMRDSYGVDVTESDPVLRKFLFDIMKEVNDEHGGNESISTKNMNNITIKFARNAYLAKVRRQEEASSVTSSQAPPLPPPSYAAATASGGGGENRNRSAISGGAAHPLERDRQVYGNRQIPFNDRPVASGARIVDEEYETSIEDSYERMIAERNGGSFDPARDMPLKQVPDTALDVDPRMTDDECLNQLNEIQMYRSQDDVSYFANARASTAGGDFSSEAKGAQAVTPALLDGDDQALNPLGKSSFNAPDAVNSSDYVIDPAKVNMNTFLKNLSINGFDRDWIADPHRYKYTVRTVNSGMHTSFRDVVAIQATCIILPMEVIRSSQATNTAYISDKPTFQHDFGLSYPYLILAIEGFEGVYDGTNDNVRKAFCKFVYSKQYRTANGRGYVILESMQDEIKRFEPAPLASLRNMTITVQRPNGSLFNDSKDDYLVARVEYESFNENFLKIVLDKHFDSNEFYQGDTVSFLGVKFGNPDGGVNKTTVFALSLLEDYLNRREGHEIIHMEPTNEGGYRQAFNIYAPGTVDQKVGKFVINNSMIKALIKHNEATTEEDTQTTGHMLNLSLQNVISMRVWMSRADMTPILGAPVRNNRTDVI
jgi:hypothetical protein